MLFININPACMYHLDMLLRCLIDINEYNMKLKIADISTYIGKFGDLVLICKVSMGS